MTMSLINVQLLCFLLRCSGELACLAPERLVRKSRGDFIFGVRSKLTLYWRLGQKTGPADFRLLSLSNGMQLINHDYMYPELAPHALE